MDAQLNLTDTYAAHSAGYTGKGVTIGIVDTGVMRDNAALTPRVLKDLIYVDSTTNNTSVDDADGHGTWVAQIAAGKPFDQFPGGIAPGADIVSARIINDKDTNTKTGGLTWNQENALLDPGQHGPDQQQREGHEQLLGRPDLERPHHRHAACLGLPELRGQLRRPGGVRRRQRQRQGAAARRHRAAARGRPRPQAGLDRRRGAGQQPPHAAGQLLQRTAAWRWTTASARPAT